MDMKKKRKWEEEKRDKKKWVHVADIETLDCVESIDKYGKDIDIVIISWPYMDSHAYNTIKQLHRVNPKALIVYIGEGCGGCTANDDFFHHFKEITDDDLFNNISANFEQWDGLHDYVALGKYKK